MQRQASDHLDGARVECDLLPGFAQGGGLGAGILRVDAAAGKAHLPAMAAQMVGPAREQDARRRLHDDRHQHGRGHALGPRGLGLRDDVRGFGLGQPAAHEGGGQGPLTVRPGVLRHVSSFGISPRGKNTPLLQTPSIIFPRTVCGSARAASS